MKKKIVNWTGFFLVSLYVCIFLFLVALGISLAVLLHSEERWEISGFLLGAAIIWCCSWVRIIPSTLNRTRFRIAIEKREQATLAQKGIHHTAKGLTVHKRAVPHTVLTFELSSGKRLAFEVTSAIFHTFLENDRGILTYKQYEEKIFFVSFQRQV